MNKNLTFALCCVMTLSITCTSNPPELNPNDKPDVEPKPARDTAWRAVVNHVLDQLASYLPYDGVTKQYYSNEIGALDSIFFAQPSHGGMDYVGQSTDHWQCDISTIAENYRSRDGHIIIAYQYIHNSTYECSEHILDGLGVIYYNSEGEEIRPSLLEGGLRDSYREDERDSIWVDTLRYTPLLPQDSGAYAIIVRHKGLVEYSFDGQEIWRLVEE